MFTAPVRIVAPSATRTDGAQQVGDDDQPDPVDPVGDGAGVEAEQQPRQLLQEHCQRDQQGRGRVPTRSAVAQRPARCRRRDWTSSWTPATTGTRDPSRAGATASRMRPTGGDATQQPRQGASDFLVRGGGDDAPASGRLHLLPRVDGEDLSRPSRHQLVVLLAETKDEGLQLGHPVAQSSILDGEAGVAGGCCSGARSAPWP